MIYSDAGGLIVVDTEVNGKLDILINEIDIQGQKLDNIESLLVGDVKDSGKIGVLERLRQIEKWIAKREWFEKVIIIAIIGNVIGTIFLLIQNSLK